MQSFADTGYVPPKPGLSMVPMPPPETTERSPAQNGMPQPAAPPQRAQPGQVVPPPSVSMVPAVAPPASPQAGMTGDAAADELLQARLAAKLAAEGFNQANPLSNSFDPSKLPGAAEMQETMQRMQSLMSLPGVGFLAKLGASPGVQRELTDMMNNPARTSWLKIQLALLVSFLLFRAWRTAKAETFRQKLWIRAYSLLLFWFMSAAVVPSVLFGASYQRFVTEVISVARSDRAPAQTPPGH